MIVASCGSIYLLLTNKYFKWKKKVTKGSANIADSRKAITQSRKLCTELQKCGAEENGGMRFAVFQKKIGDVQQKLSELLLMIPKPKLYITNYRKLAQALVRLREEKVLIGSAWLIVKCCMFVFIFTEKDFTKGGFWRLINNPELEDDDDFIKKDEK